MINPPQLHRRESSLPLDRRHFPRSHPHNVRHNSLRLPNWRGKKMVAGPEGDNLIGTRRDDLIIGGAGDDRLLGGRGNDVIKGAGGQDALFGGPGNDLLYGGPGYDILRGGRGRDQIMGGSGPDILLGGAGGDRLHGEGGDDILEGGPGNDLLDGGRGSDGYVFGMGDGHDIVINEAQRPADIDRVILRQGIQRGQVWFRRTGVDLEMILLGCNASMTMRDWYASTPHRVDRFELANGRSITSDRIDALVDAMAVFDPVANSPTSVPIELARELKPLLAQSWR